MKHTWRAGGRRWRAQWLWRVSSRCSSGSAPVDNGPDLQSVRRRGERSSPVGAGHDSNPDGVPYPPPGGYGRTARIGNTPGQRHPELQVPGVSRRRQSKGLQTVSLADYYDPCNKPYKLLHLSVAAVWCEPCNEETDAVVADLNSADERHQGRQGRLHPGARRRAGRGRGGDAEQSRTTGSTAHVELHRDARPRAQNLGGFFNAAADPWNCDIDVRTMEMLDSSEGWSGDVNSEIQPGPGGAAGDAELSTPRQRHLQLIYPRA